MGCAACDMQAAPYLTWLTPCVLMTALVACAATLLELRYQKLVRTGAYNPKTCTMSHKEPPMPLARIRTHRWVELDSRGTSNLLCRNRVLGWLVGMALLYCVSG